MNQKGGVGKTTTTVNLGAALAMRGRRCLLVDLDPQAHCTLHFGVEPDKESPTVYDLLLELKCSVHEVLYRGRENLDLIPAEVSLAAAEVELTTQPGREMILREKLESVQHEYDYILFDCPPSLGLLTLNALVASGEVVIPMQAHFLPLQGVGKLLETVALVRQRLNRDLSIGGIVLCAHDGQTTLAREIVADLREFFEQGRANGDWNACEIFEPPIRRNVKLAEAPSFGQTIFEYESWCAGASDYAQLAENMIRHWEGEDASVEIVAPTQREAREPIEIAQPKPHEEEPAPDIEPPSHDPPLIETTPIDLGNKEDQKDSDGVAPTPDVCEPSDQPLPATTPQKPDVAIEPKSQACAVEQAGGEKKKRCTMPRIRLAGPDNGATVL